MSSNKSFKDFAPGAIPTPPPSPTQKRMRMAIIALSALVAFLLVVKVLPSITDGFSAIGSGVIVGQVVDGYGRPLSAELIVERTDIIVQTDTDGRFELRGVPRGAQILLVANDGIGVEYPVNIRFGQTVDVGAVQAEVTAIPAQ